MDAKSLSPICLCALFTALVLQNASYQRDVAIPDDALGASLLQYVHPAAGAFLLVGYLIAVMAIVLPLRKR